MSAASDPRSDLLRRLRERDPEVLAQIVNEHAHPLFRASRGMGFSADESEDLVQEVFLTFLETLDRFEARSATRTWLFGILHHKVRERRRSNYKEMKQDPIDEVREARFDSPGNWVQPPVDLHRLVESQELGNAIRYCMENLTATQREVFVLRDMQDLDSEEVCKILGVTRTNMFVLTSRARSKLRECLEKKEIAGVK